MNINLNKKDDLKKNIFDIDNDLSMNQNVDNCKRENDTLSGDIIRSIDKMLNENENIKENIELLNNPIFAPIIPKGVNNIEYLNKIKNFLSIKIHLLFIILIFIALILTKSQFLIIFKIKCSSSIITF